MVNSCAVCGCCTRTDIVREHLEDTLRICDVSAKGLYQVSHCSLSQLPLCYHLGVNTNSAIDLSQLPLCYHLGVNTKSAIALSQMKGVHFGKASGRSTPRRSSSRSIKRKKFDDELVESSLKNPGKPLGLAEVLEGKEKFKKVRIK